MSRSERCVDAKNYDIKNKPEMSGSNIETVSTQMREIRIIRNGILNIV